MGKAIKQVQIVVKATPTPGQGLEPTAYFDADGTPIDLSAGGATGPKGDTGDTGATGATGPKGDKGDPGTPGTDGADGTTPPAGTAALLTAGTDTVSRSWSAKDIADYVAAQIAP